MKRISMVFGLFGVIVGLSIGIYLTVTPEELQAGFQALKESTLFKVAGWPVCAIGVYLVTMFFVKKKNM